MEHALIKFAWWNNILLRRQAHRRRTDEQVSRLVSGSATKNETETDGMVDKYYIFHYNLKSI